MQPLPRLIYNPSDSVAVGWYRVEPLQCRAASLPRPLSVGSIILTTLPPDAAALAAPRGYLPVHVPLLKRVVAIAPQHVGIIDDQVRIDGVPMAADARSDSEGQRRKARQKGVAPGRPQSQSARGGGAARCRIAAVPLGR